MGTLWYYSRIIVFIHLFLHIKGKQRFSTNVCSTGSTNAEGGQKAGTELYRKILESYVKELRPVTDESQAIHVNVSITLANVIDISEKEQSLTTLLWMMTEWDDPFLAWNETEFPGIKFFSISADRIWTPDLMVYNVLGNTIQVAEEFLGKFEGLNVMSSGRVRHWTPVVLTLFCPMNMELFPFDVQSCLIVLAPWSYDNTQLRLWPTEDVATVGKFQWDVSKKWIIKDFTGRKNIEHYSATNRSYDEIIFAISLKRKSTFYVLNLLLPCCLISIIACLCYVIPPQGGDRINLLLTTFLSIVVFVLVVLEIVPEESDSLPLFSKFLLGVMLMNMFQIFYCICVCGINSTDEICFGPPRCLVTWATCMTSCWNRSK